MNAEKLSVFMPIAVPSRLFPGHGFSRSPRPTVASKKRARLGGNRISVQSRIARICKLFEDNAIYRVYMFKQPQKLKQETQKVGVLPLSAGRNGEI